MSSTNPKTPLSLRLVQPRLTRQMVAACPNSSFGAAAVLRGHEPGPFGDATLVLGELDGRPDLVALALAFFLVGRDAVAAPGGDVLQAQKSPLSGASSRVPQRSQTSGPEPS